MTADITIHPHNGVPLERAIEHALDIANTLKKSVNVKLYSSDNIFVSPDDDPVTLAANYREYCLNKPKVVISGVAVTCWFCKQKKPCIRAINVNMTGNASTPSCMEPICEECSSKQPLNLSDKQSTMIKTAPGTIEVTWFK